MRRAYTLTELLVVIVILAILASFLFPVGSRAKLSAQLTGCRSNLHQMEVALELYMNDYGDLPPQASAGVLERLYLGGKKLRDPAQTLAPALEDYFPTYLPDPKFVAPGTNGPQFVKDWWACREARGQDFPLVIDANHSSAMAAYAAGGQAFFLLTRASGQVARTSVDVWNAYVAGRLKPPCSLDVGFLNL